MCAGVPKLEILFLGLYKDEAYADSFPCIKYPGLTTIQIGSIFGHPYVRHSVPGLCVIYDPTIHRAQISNEGGSQ